MNKLKIALTLLNVAIIVGPLAGITYVYRDNLVGLILHPQLKSLTSSGSSSSQSSQSLPNLKLPQPVGQPQYNQHTGAFSYSFNFTNPSTTEISFSQFSAEVCTENNVPLGNVSIAQPINVAAGATALVNVTGNLSQSEINQLTAQYQNCTDLNVALENVNVNVGGITAHIDHIDAGSISTTG